MARDERAEPGELEDLGGAPALDAAARLRVLSIGGLVSIALAQGGLRFSRRLLAAALGPLKSARVHLCAAMRNYKPPRPHSPCKTRDCQDIFTFGIPCWTLLKVQNTPKGPRRRLANQARHAARRARAESPT